MTRVVYCFCHPELGSGSKEIMNYIYIMTNTSKTLYVGVTNNLMRRVYEHKTKRIKGFTKKYNITKLVYYEEYKYIDKAIWREKQLKNWHRQWKINLIEETNKNWEDLSNDWFTKDELADSEWLSNYQEKNFDSET